MTVDRLPSPYSYGRRVLGVAGAALLLCIGLALARSIAGGDLLKTSLLGALVAAPSLAWLALNRPYVFPYGLYVLVTPFDGLLNFSGAGTVTKFLGLASVVALLISCLLRRRFVRPPVAVWWLLGFLLWNLLSLFWAVDLPAAQVDATTLGSLVALYVTLSISPLGERDLRAICDCIVAGGVALAVYGMYILHVSPDAMGDSGRLVIAISDTHRIDPNHFANSLLAPLALALVGLAHARTPLRFIAFACATGIVLDGILLSLSREALLGVALILVALALFSRRRLLGFALLVPPMFVIPALVPTIGQRMSVALSTGGAGRTSIWHVAWFSFLQRPLAGWGIGNAATSYDANFLSVYQRYDSGWSMPPHNTYLHVLVELGIVGFLLGAAALAAILPQLRGIPRGDSLFDLRVALTASLCAMLFVACFIDLATYKYLWLVLTSIAQLAVIVRLRAERAESACP